MIKIACFLSTVGASGMLNGCDERSVWDFFNDVSWTFAQPGS